MMNKQNILLKLTISIIILTCISLVISSQVNLNQSLGSIQNIERNDNEFTLITEFGKAKVIVYSPSVIRIRIVKGTFEKEFSYAVIAKPKETEFRLFTSPDVYTIETDSLQLHIGKDPLRFTFVTIEGKVINADEPAFGTSWIGDEVTTYKTLHKNERFIGLGEHTGNLDRRGSAFTNWNTDNPNYDNNSKSLYASIPFYIGLHDSLCYGIFLDNSSKTHFNFGASNNRFSSFTAEYGEMDYYFIYHSSVRDIIKSYTGLTGRMPLPPTWSLGYQQCRWSYFPDKDVLSVANKFRERKIPADVIYLDIHYMDSYKLFTWNTNRFPSPDKMIDKLESIGFKTTVIIDPGVKIENEYPVYEDGLKKDVFIKYPDATNYAGEVWPGWCHFPDFSMSKTREWWSTWVKTYAEKGITGYWNDMNEIAAWGQDVPGMLQFNWEGKTTSYKEAKNCYALLMARSTYEGAQKHMNSYRPFVLTRAGYAGLQRYTAIWTGDNQASDDHMLLGNRLLVSLGLSGISFTGVDIGGFGGNPSSALYTRWMTLGAFMPMFRGHTSFNSNRSEPWVFGEKAEDIARRYIGFRYQLMPYIYSSFHESTINGMPLARSLAIDYPFENRIYDYSYQHEYLFGPSILITPVKSTEAIAKVFLPEGEWYYLFNDASYSGNNEIFIESPLEKLPVFIKAGSILPMQNLIQHTGQEPGDTLYLHVYNGDIENQFTYYEDDGLTFNYNTGEYYKRDIKYIPKEKKIIIGKVDGNYRSKFSTICILFHGFNFSGNQKVAVDNKIITIREKHIRLFKSDFAFADFGPYETLYLNSVIFENKNEDISIEWE